ncbi:hydroxysteroid 11-beta-dehydrogenase 1-like protein isoform X4 [Phocoena sinus]|uniref:hydroxysteroid 11-beta-dehydrogenase 1-like protein isoform X4 n=1 Tax=Phocoena sinus TaxID=42100 RepID=UPI0013C4460B|nr:hydroxysteroid 11-beta-dehydrogenase 1-like protein isoform X4 [Phocoena sinus]
MKVLLLVGLGALFFAYYWDDNFDPASLQGARVLLTGASVGVGEELAYHYARLGSHLVLTAHTEALLQKVVGNCRKLGAPKVFYIAADMASPEVPERVVQFALDKLGGLDYLVMNHLGTAPAGTRGRSAQATRWLMQALGSAPAPSGLRFLLRPVTRSRHLQVNFLSYVQLTSLALPSLTDSKGSLVVVSSLLGRVPTSFSSPYSAAKFALDSLFGSLRRELDVQDVNVAITMCVLGLQDRASAAEGVRGVTRAKAAPGPKAALAVIRGSATRASGVFYPWRFHLLCLLRGWMPQPRAWFIRQELNITTPAAA